jgi:hypothetical protein
VDLAALLIRRACKLYASESVGVELDNTVYALDSSTIDLCLSLFDWAPFRSTKAAVKLHTLLDLRGSIPTFIHVSDGKLPDVKVLDMLSFEPGAFYVMDRGYVGFAVGVALDFGQAAGEALPRPRARSCAAPHERRRGAVGGGGSRHSTASGPVTTCVLRRQRDVFGDARFERLASISVGHLGHDRLTQGAGARGPPGLHPHSVHQGDKTASRACTTSMRWTALSSGKSWTACR